MRLADSGRLLNADKEAVKLGIPAIRLMENASVMIAQEAVELAGENKTCAVFCGSGNNGGDGLGAAIQLLQEEFVVNAYIVSDSRNMSDEFAEMAERLMELGVGIELFDPKSRQTVDFVKNCGVIIDAIFGLGLSREITGLPLDAIKFINKSPAPVVSADIPSGVEADTGCILGGAVKADITVTFSLAKPGHFITPGSLMRGRLVIADIGLPDDLLEPAVGNVSAMTVDDLSLPVRNADSSKWDYGRVFIIAGSVGYTGAPIMASKAALRTGSGLVFLAVPNSIYNITAVKSDEVMVIPYQSTADGMFSELSADKIIKKLTGCDVCLLGCGLGRGRDTVALVEKIIHSCKVPLILDADGINAITWNINVLKEATCPVIMTPHEREFIRMGGDLSKGRLRGALKFAARFNCIVVLKGSGTITALPDGTAYVNTTGNPGMAKGGSGDILAGMIAAFIGMKYPPELAAAYGVLLHGLSGDIAKNRLTEYAMTPMDMLESVPEAFKIILGE